MDSRKPLTHHRQAEAAKPEAKPYKLNAGDGLFLEITPKGSKRWRFRYFFDGKEQMLSMGLFPAVGLLDAKEARDQAKRQIAQWINPSQQRKDSKDVTQQLPNTFANLAKDWLSNKEDRSTATQQKAEWLLQFAILEFGNKQMNEITPPMVLSACRKLEGAGKHETANRVKMTIGQVFRYAVAIGKADRDPTADLRGILKPPKVSHRAAIIEPTRLGHLLRDMEAYSGSVVTYCALNLAPLLFVRPGELRSARWADIDLQKETWSYTPPKTRNQTGVDLVVPLSRQSLALLARLKPLTGEGEFVFAGSGREGYLSEAAVLNALKRLGYGGEVTGHGFRATARTLLDEELGYRIEYIEMQLGHEVRDVHGRAYNRTKYLPERVAMMQAWADYLDQLKGG